MCIYADESLYYYEAIFEYFNTRFQQSHRLTPGFTFPTSLEDSIRISYA